VHPTIRRLAQRSARRLGYHVVPATFYSPIPDIDEVDPELWRRPSELTGVDFDLDRQLEFVERELGEKLKGFTPPDAYEFDNPTFSPADTVLLDAMLAHFAPARVLELGSGASSLVIARRQLEGGYRVVDPYPSPLLERAARRPELRQVSTADIPVDWVTELGPGDILFADTTHTVRVGGDVPRLVLDLLPRVPAGVIVHVHDIFWPFPYPRHFYEKLGFYWQEQELVQALLVENDRWEILAANHALWRLRTARMRELVPVEVGPVELAGGSLWLRRR
jgi:hypothetical protein